MGAKLSCRLAINQNEPCTLGQLRMPLLIVGKPTAAQVDHAEVHTSTLPATK